MPSRLRNLLIIAIAAVLAVVIGVEFANENYSLGVAVLAVLCWVFLDWAGGARAEAWVLAVVIVGYIVGNRGFAQISLVNRLPLLPAECALLVGVPAVLYRAVFGQASPVRRDALNLAIFAWMAVGAARLPLDFRREGMLALRDFAMVYYAVFFFVAQGLADHARSVKLLQRAISLGFLALPLVAVAYLRYPDFFFQYVSVRGVPVVFHKSDLIATSLAAGFCWFWAQREETGRKWWLVPAAISLPVITLMASPRAAMVALAGVTGFWLAARRWRLLGFQTALITGGVLAALPVMFFFHENIKDTPLYSAYEHAVSIVDFTGQGTYLHAESGDPGDNNRFRLVWWQAVARETIEVNPAFGLGFGYDLTSRFLADYDWLTNEDFSARSPHSMIMSVFGRMGAVGLLLWLAVAVAMARLTRRTFSRRDFRGMGWWSVVWVIWISACFGVVLEGPMAAVLFWTVLGIANVSSPAGAAAAEPADSPPEDLPEPATADQLAPTR